jgi:hypothetical protein
MTTHPGRLAENVDDGMMSRNFGPGALKLKRSPQWEVGFSDPELEAGWRGLDLLTRRASESDRATDGWILKDSLSEECAAQVVELTEVVDDEADLGMRRENEKLYFSLEGAHYVLDERHYRFIGVA